MAIQEKKIWVYADWSDLKACKLLGILTAQHVRGKEIFSFEYEKEWLQNDHSLFLDPNLNFYQGKQYLQESENNFGVFLDSSPDRWGRLLMRRRESILAKQENRNEKIYFESDYLLGVFDGHRMGGLRFKQDPSGEFLNDNREMASPPWTSLRELEYASLQLENEDAVNDPQYLKWLSMLVDPGSSLGGARPKASVIDEKQHLWIAKFPSVQDTKDVGAWEMVVHALAVDCGIHVPEAKLIRFSGKHHTFLSKRFDRTETGQRIHYASAMTMLGYSDGADSNEGVSYLEMASFIIQRGNNVTQELEQLWRRILFNILISNTDDHLRNHGFLLTKSGWQLSPAYDMNPNEFGTGLKLNINDNSNDLDVSLALEVAKYFKLSEVNSNRILTEMQKSLKDWSKLAKHFGIGNSEIELTKNAFKNILFS
jgi:serine/threonine-protein kinase HipA